MKHHNPHEATSQAMKFVPTVPHRPLPPITLFWGVTTDIAFKSIVVIVVLTLFVWWASQHLLAFGIVWLVVDLILSHLLGIGDETDGWVDSFFSLPYAVPFLILAPIGLGINAIVYFLFYPSEERPYHISVQQS